MSRLFALPSKTRGFSPVDGPTLKGNVIREVAVTPNRSEISVVNSDYDYVTIGMIHLAVKEGADIERDELVVVVVAVVILPKMQMINGAVDNAHTYELTKGTELLNNGKAYTSGNPNHRLQEVFGRHRHRYSLLSVLIY